MLHLGSTSFAYLDTRTYVHSTDVFRLFCERMAKQPVDDQPVHVKSFKFTRETGRNGSLFLASPDDEPTEATARSVAVLTFRDGQQRERRFYLNDDGPPVSDRRPAQRIEWERPAQAQDFAGQLTCHRIQSNADLFFAIIEGNKAIHVETLRRRGDNAPSAFRFVYCESVPFPMPCPPDSPIVLRFSHLGTRRAGDRVYTLNNVQFAAEAAPIRLCFSY